MNGEGRSGEEEGEEGECFLTIEQELMCHVKH